MNNYDKIYIVRDFNCPSVRWDGEWSNNKDNEFVECIRDVFLTQTVKIQLGREKDIPLICFVNEESMVSGIEHLSPGTNNNGTLVFSLLYVCEEKQKE